MVFQKMTNEQKQFLFDLKATASKEDIASMRALIMRGASTTEAKQSVVERTKAKQEYLEQMEKQVKPVTAPEKKAKAKPKATAKHLEVEAPQTEEEPTRKRRTKAAPTDITETEQEPMSPTIEYKPKPRKQAAQSAIKN